MKLAIGLGLVVGASASLPGERDLTAYTFGDYIAEFGKRYNQNDLDRKTKFEKNLKTILAHNADPSKSFFMTVNDFTDMSQEEFKAMYLGGLPDLEDSFFIGEFTASEVKDLPTSLDWRDTAGVVTSVKNQGGCGSCWAFSTVETLESHYAITLNTSAPILSPQQVTSCTPNPNHCGGTGGCGGNIQTQGFNYTAQAGITTETAYPYSGQTGTCEQDKIKPCAKNDGYVKVKVNDYNAHMQAVQIGPVSISVAAQTWQMYGGGVLNRCDCDMDHAVQLVGYGTDSAQGDYWLVRNSWGGGWGERGYIRVQRYGDGKEPTCTDNTPQDGEACQGDTKPRTYAGLCGILGSSSYPTGMKNAGDCGPAPSPPGPSPPPGPTPPVPPLPPGPATCIVIPQSMCSQDPECEWCPSFNLCWPTAYSWACVGNSTNNIVV